MFRDLLELEISLAEGMIWDRAVKILRMCMQETEINFNLDHKLLSFPGFSIETENNSQISRVAFYIVVSIEFFPFAFNTPS